MLKGFEDIPSLSNRAVERIDDFKRGIENYTGGKRIKSRVIEKALSLSGSEVRAIVSHLRGQSYPVGSDSSGYFLAQTPSEIESTIEQLTGRATKIAVCANGLKRWRNLKVTGSDQMEIGL